jgi:ankyrin repeat protein
LVKTVIEKYQPRFDEGDTSLVAYITIDLLEYNHNPGLLDYLVQNGLTAGVPQTSEAISYFIKKNDFNTVKMLDEKGFKIDTSNDYLMETAISNRNVDIIQFLLQRQFNPNRPNNEYTYLEYAILSNAEPVIDVLLKLKPDITTLHDTDDETAINALLLAQKNNRTAMLEKLKAYSRP